MNPCEAAKIQGGLEPRPVLFQNRRMSGCASGDFLAPRMGLQTEKAAPAALARPLHRNFFGRADDVAAENSCLFLV